MHEVAQTSLKAPVLGVRLGVPLWYGPIGHLATMRKTLKATGAFRFVLVSLPQTQTASYTARHRAIWPRTLATIDCCCAPVTGIMKKCERNAQASIVDKCSAPVVEPTTPCRFTGALNETTQVYKDI